MKENTNKLKRMYIDTYQEPVVYMLSDCNVCISEGFRAQSRIRIKKENSTVVATLNILNSSDFLNPDEAGLSESAWKHQ